MVYLGVGMLNNYCVNDIILCMYIWGCSRKPYDNLHSKQISHCLGCMRMLQQINLAYSDNRSSTTKTASPLYLGSRVIKFNYISSHIRSMLKVMAEVVPCIRSGKSNGRSSSLGAVAAYSCLWHPSQDFTQNPPLFVSCQSSRDFQPILHRSSLRGISGI